MASARGRLGAARRSIIKRQKKSDVFSGIFSTASTVGAFAAGQAKKATTAWEEYETGYKAIGGTEDITKPKFGDEGWLKSTFKGPEGDVTIGGKIYDKSKIRKAGGFLGSETATALFAGKQGEKIRESYLKRTVPGRLDPLDPASFTKPATEPHMITPFTKPAIGPHMVAPKTDEYSATSVPPVDYIRPMSSSYDPSKITQGPQIPDQNLPLHGLSSEEVGRKEAQEQQWRFNRMPEASSYETSQEQLYRDDPYKTLQETYEDQWK